MARPPGGDSSEEPPHVPHRHEAVTARDPARLPGGEPILTPTRDTASVASAGRPSAPDLEAALAALAPEVIGFMQHHCGDPHLGADLGQEALARAMRCLATLRDPDALRGWVFRIAINLFNDHLRRVALEPRAGGAGSLPGGDESCAPGPGPERELLARELDEVLRASLHQLPERQRTVLMLHGVRDLGHAQIAALLGISLDAVKMSLFHAREKMRVRLARYLDHVPPKRSLRNLNHGAGP